MSDHHGRGEPPGGAALATSEVCVGGHPVQGPSVAIDDDDHLVPGQLARLHFLGEEASTPYERDGVRSGVDRREIIDDLGPIIAAAAVQVEPRTAGAAEYGRAGEATGEVRVQRDGPAEVGAPARRGV